MTAYFQVKDSTNPNKIAVVHHSADIASFRCDANWYELSEEQYKELKEPVVKPKAKKTTKEI